MNTTQKGSLIDDMLAQLDSGRQSMTKQASAIADIMDKSNNVLLQIEATRVSKPTTAAVPQVATAAPYTYTKETVQTLAKVIEQFSQLQIRKSNNADHLDSGLSFEEYLHSNRQRMEYLGSGVRKLLAVADTVAQMKHNLLQDEGCFSDEDKEEETSSE